MKPKVIVYKDEGVGPLSYRALFKSLKKSSLLDAFEIKTLNAKGVIEGSWKEDCALFILPGGRDVPYHKALKGKGNKHLKEYVENGGQFLGICAGAYYGCGEVIFEEGSKGEICQKRELQFFQGAAFGPLYNLKPYCYEGHVSAYAAPILFEGESFHTYYNGGCTFRDAEESSSLKILAVYQDSYANSPALIECKVGKGTAILSGVHLEVEAKFCVNESTLYEKLLKSDAQREKLFERILKRLLVLELIV